ncbi:4-cresol dehydrogenase [hydroxylating] flavoprotein subunit [Vibrio stylophorae]|uniref:4-cresol dehydrogenase [hydroxylating] flavoprotein subunit n=1 Tax=Vibrio stylophorae TaxID=659351 RepID=A0ABN8DXA2_9VIBR|nr:FAD-binding oxidoreductase [Vibrio stylophorae]CAH0535773.1 4-cresol dehydrogenase [hydroxylating] flavoprotein subunit [Vibrio stylophorae]
MTSVEVISAIFSADKWSQKSEQLDEYALALNGSTCRPAAIVWPDSENDLKNLIQAANTHHFSLHIVAQGKNWGYGTAQAPTADQVVVNLKQMDRVLEVNETDAYVRIQPGVTQSQLYQAIVDSGADLQLDITAAGKHTSIVGNVLERGFGHTDYSDRFGHVLALRVLLPSGEIIETGMGAYQHSVAKHIYPYGVGPVLQGLFSQSNLGIVLEMTLALQPKPEYDLNVLILCKNFADAPKVVCEIARLKRLGIVTSGVHTASMARAMGAQAQKMAGAWVITSSLSGPKTIAKARYREMKKALKKVVPSLRFVALTERRWNLIQWVNKHLKSELLGGLKIVWDLKKGVPTDEAIKTLLDEKSAHSHMKTAEFPAYFRWICAVTSSQPKDIKRMLGICQPLFAEFGYEERYTMTNVTERAVVLIANIRYDKTPESLARAKAFYQTLDQALLDEGFCPYRSGSGLFDAATPYLEPNHLALLQKLKAALDPNMILSPGKYWCGGAASSTESSTKPTHKNEVNSLI